MKLPEKSAQLIYESLTSQSLLEKSDVDALIESLRQERSLNWNLILTKQFKLEQGGNSETED